MGVRRSNKSWGLKSSVDMQVTPNRLRSRRIHSASTGVSNDATGTDNTLITKELDAFFGESFDIPVVEDEVVCALGGISQAGIVWSGYVVGGGKNELVEPEDRTLDNGDVLYIKCVWTGIKEDEVLKPGGTMGAITVHEGSSVPDDEVPTVLDLVGAVYYPLVSRDGGGNLVSSGCGTINISFCPGGYIKSRS